MFTITEQEDALDPKAIIDFISERVIIFSKETSLSLRFLMSIGYRLHTLLTTSFINVTVDPKSDWLPALLCIRTHTV